MFLKVIIVRYGICGTKKQASKEDLVLSRLNEDPRLNTEVVRPMLKDLKPVISSQNMLFHPSFNITGDGWIFLPR
jgi:hypothetical protein